MSQTAEKPDSYSKATSQALELVPDRILLSWKPYIQLSRFAFIGGSLMIYWPCAWALTIVATGRHLPPSAFTRQCVMFLCWSIFLNSVGSIWNDICDKDYDRLVERTKNRPLVIGAVSVRAAILWMCPQVAVLILLLAQLNNLAFALGLFEIFVLTVIYPFTKRITYWPQAWLGITLAWGSLIAYATNAPPNWPLMLLLLFTGCSWTIFYDTIYAMLDRKDDIKAGIGSTALLFGNHTRPMLALFAGLVVLGLAFTGFLTHQRLPFFILSVLGAAIHFTWQITTVVFEDGPSCVVRFKSNGTQLGFIIWSGMLVNYCLTLVENRWGH